MEPVVAVVDTYEFSSFREFSFIGFFISLAKSFQAYVTSSAQVVVVIRHYFLNSSVHVVNDLFVLFNFTVAMLFTALLNVFLYLR